MEMFKIADFVILHLLKTIFRLFAYWFAQLAHEFGFIDHYILKYLINILLYGKEISLDSLLLKEFDLRILTPWV
jgi:hypothetical protein